MISKTKSLTLLTPALVGVVLPVLLSIIDPWRFGGFKIGLIVSGFGLILLLICLIDFTAKAKETLAPFDPPTKLVKKGPYRYIRNPIYSATLLLAVGIEIISASVLLAFYLVIVFLILHFRVVLFEEPSLAKKYAEWEEYSQNVPRWIPRRSHWRGWVDKPSDNQSS